MVAITERVLVLERYIQSSVLIRIVLCTKVVPESMRSHQMEVWYIVVAVNLYPVQSVEGGEGSPIRPDDDQDE